MIGENHVILDVLSNYDPIPDGANPMARLPGNCFGGLEIIGMTASGSGHCVFSDRAGNTLATGWVATGFGAEGAIVGTWVVTGGNGAMVGATGGGHWSNVTDDASGTFVNSITGAITLP